MTKWIVGALVAVAMLVGVPIARAEDVHLPPQPTDEPLIGVPLIESLEPVAQAYWDLRDVKLPPAEVFSVKAMGVGIRAAAEEGGDRIWVTEGFLHAEPDELQCIVWLHERGHTAGLTHESPDPVMAPDPLAVHGFHVPPKCKAWARDH